MQLLDGKQLSEIIAQEVKIEVDQRLKEGKKRPHLAAVLVGNVAASKVYVRNKIRLCEKVGFESSLVEIPETASEAEILEKVEALNADPNVDGFIVQLPLPDGVDENKITLAIDPQKDVDGFHPTNFGRMAQGLDCYLPATPFGILQLLERNEIEVSGKECVVLGRSNIVGTPISILLSRKAYPGNATVTLCHSRTKDLSAHTKKADIIIAAIGIPNFLKGDMVKEGAVVIDVGINRVDAPDTKRGYKLVGDVEFDSVSPKSSFITPVPGGVGPMTVMSLIKNTLKAANQEINF